LSSFKKRSLYFCTHCIWSAACSGMFHPSKIKHSFHFILV
jgi:hypothetical protein